MSRNCIKCCVNDRTGPDLLCDACRAKQHLAPDADGAGTWYVSAVSGMKYRQRGAAGDLSAIIIDGERFALEQPDDDTEADGAELDYRPVPMKTVATGAWLRQDKYDDLLARVAAAEAKAREAEAQSAAMRKGVGELLSALEAMIPDPNCDAPDPDDLRGFARHCVRLGLDLMDGTSAGRKLLEQVAAAEAARDAAVGLLDDAKEYIRHADDCTPDDCTCGVRKIIERVDAALAAPPAGATGDA